MRLRAAVAAVKLDDSTHDLAAMYEYAAIRGKHPAKLAAGLLGGKQAIDSEGNNAGDDGRRILSCS